MCGLVGTAGNLSHRDEHLIKRLLIFDTLRGLDSTGLASVRNTDEIRIAKAASHPFDLFETKRFQSTLDGFNSKILLGHNRAATTGATTSLNAHPFEIGEIVGAHNGTLEKACWKLLEQNLGETFDVDSQALFAAINEFGIEETINMVEEGRTSSTGAWALTWYDKTDDSLNFIRNKHRPLWVAYSEKFDQVFWASEWPMLYSALEMSSQPYKLYEDESSYRFFSLPVDSWFKVDMSELVKGSNKNPLKFVKSIKGKEPKAVTFTGHTPPFHRGVTTTVTGGVTKPSRSADDVRVFTIPVGKDNPLLAISTVEELSSIMRHGCAWCEEPVSTSDSGGILIEDYHSYICGDCAQLDERVTKVYLGDREFEKIYKD